MFIITTENFEGIIEVFSKKNTVLLRNCFVFVKNEENIRFYFEIKEHFFFNKLFFNKFVLIYQTAKKNNTF